MNASLEALDEKLLAAHEAADFVALVGLYQMAGEQMLARGDVDAGCFYLTHAYIFALECGHVAVPGIHRILVAYGREE